jgi:hypothetical protein
MTMETLKRVLFCALLCCCLLSRAKGASINVGNYQTAQDGAPFDIPIRITGSNEPVTDMAGVIQIAGSSTSVPVMTALSYSNSIWSSVSGGFFAFATVTNSICDPNVSIASTNQHAVISNSLLITLSVNPAGVPPGQYQINLTGVVLSPGTTNSTRLKNGQADVPLAITNGTITVLPKMRAQVLSPGAVSLRFKTFVGQTNVLQWRTNLLTGAWQDYQPSFLGSGNEVIWSEPTSGTNSTRKFYRLKVQN